MNPLISLIKTTLPPPSETDKRANVQRIEDALGIEALDIPLPVMRRIPLQTGTEINCIIGSNGNGFKLIDIATNSSFSIALDIGTTNLVAALYDNVRKQLVNEIKVENPQIKYGSDILTRLHHAMSGKEKEINQCLTYGVNKAISKLCTMAGIKKYEIHALVAAGNTVMSHFFLGLDISTIPVEPFVPVVRKPGFFSGADLHLDINPEAIVYVFPNAGSYVGGDILAGILASGLYNSESPCVLIDVGTNAEIVVGNRDWMLVGAGAAGPALEEGIAGIGKRAESGIIYDINIHKKGIECITFDNAGPKGICGSGMVSLIHEMYRTGIIGNNGLLDPENKDILKCNGDISFKLSCAGSSLVIKQTEIDNFLRSKAAMFTLLLVLLRSVGLEFKDIHKVYIAGALGNGIDAGKAAGIGMLPNWPDEKIVPVGNASLQGALMILKDSDLLSKEDELADIITYKHMHDDPEFMKEFMGAIFIPHTNPELLQV